MKNKKLKFGCHDFLNAKPLTYPLSNSPSTPFFHMEFDTPSNLAAKVAKRELDLAVIPSIEYARIDHIAIVPGFSISSLGQIETVTLFCTKEIHNIETIAVDTSSKTSVAMLSILLAERFKVHPKLIPCEPDIEKMMDIADAGLIIGDNAFKIENENFSYYDLGEEWYHLSGRPFVHALLVVQDGIQLGEGVEVIQKALIQGQKNLDAIVASETERLGLSSEVCNTYLTKRVRYTLEKPELDGLTHFFNLAEKHHLIQQSPPIRFYGA